MRASSSLSRTCSGDMYAMVPVAVMIRRRRRDFWPDGRILLNHNGSLRSEKRCLILQGTDARGHGGKMLEETSLGYSFYPEVEGGIPIVTGVRAVAISFSATKRRHGLHRQVFAGLRDQPTDYSGSAYAPYLNETGDVYADRVSVLS